MSSPAIVSVSPEVDATGVLLLEPIEVLFDQEVDTDSIVKEGNFILSENVYRVIKTGAKPLDYEDTLDPDYLSSRGFKGIIDGSVSFQKINPANLDEYTGTLDYDLEGNLWRTKLIFQPTQPLSATTPFSVLLGSSLCTRTIGDVTETITGTGSITPIGPYTGTVDDTVTIEIATGGNRVTGEFIWSTVTSPTPVGPISLSKYPITLDEDTGLKVQFNKGIFNIGDTFSFKIKAPEYLENIYAWSFRTGSEEAVAPEIVSDTVIDVTVVDSTAEAVNPDFKITKISPEHGSSNMPLSTLDITFTFNSDIDASTINTSSVYGEGVLVNRYWSDGLPLPTTAVAAGELTLTTTVAANVLIVSIELGSGGTLPPDNEIRIWLTSDIKSESGESLNNYLYWFTTRYTPIYADVSEIYAKIGSIIGSDFPEDIIYRLLLRYSILSDHINPYGLSRDPFTWRLARNNWIICQVSRDLIANIDASRGSGGKKRLADLSVQLPEKGSSSLLNNLDQCVFQAERLMLTTGVNTVLVAEHGGKLQGEPNFGRKITGYSNSSLPLINASWVEEAPATQYSTARMMEKILGNYRPVQNSFSSTLQSADEEE